MKETQIAEDVSCRRRVVVVNVCCSVVKLTDDLLYILKIYLYRLCDFSVIYNTA